VIFLAYRPFIDPLNLHAWWYVLLVPCAFLVAFTYKAIRIPNIKRLPRDTAVMAMQIILGMVALGAAGYLFIEVVLPRLVR
jgi:prolipoprotein diacylglyceryltransferase